MPQPPTMRLELDDPRHCGAFIRLNEQWITAHFAIEEADRRLADNPMQIVADGGHIIALTANDRPVGFCALFNEGDAGYQLARMAVEPDERGKGHGDALIRAALELAASKGARSVYLVSNTRLEAAIGLYRKHGFVTRSEGRHPVYARANIVMERSLENVAVAVAGAGRRND